MAAALPVIAGVHPHRAARYHHTTRPSEAQTPRSNQDGRYHDPPPQRDFDRPHHLPQSSRIEILNEGGFRSDGRRQYELRDITFDSTAQAGADGSTRVAHGLTEVLVSVFGPREARVRAQTLHDRASIHVEATIAAFSTSDRRRRGRGDKCVTSSFICIRKEKKR